MHQEYQVQPYEFLVSQETRPSSPAVTSLASPLHCISHFLSCVCQTFSRSRKQKPPIREGAKQAEAGGDAKAPRFGLLRCLGKNKVQPHETLQQVEGDIGFPCVQFYSFFCVIFHVAEFASVKERVVFMQISSSLNRQQKQNNRLLTLNPVVGLLPTFSHQAEVGLILGQWFPKFMCILLIYSISLILVNFSENGSYTIFSF